jgi:hypothetical protein
MRFPQVARIDALALQIEPKQSLVDFINKRERVFAHEANYKWRRKDILSISTIPGII